METALAPCRSEDSDRQPRDCELEKDALKKLKKKLQVSTDTSLPHLEEKLNQMETDVKMELEDVLHKQEKLNLRAMYTCYLKISVEDLKEDVSNQTLRVDFLQKLLQAAPCEESMSKVKELVKLLETDANFKMQQIDYLHQITGRRVEPASQANKVTTMLGELQIEQEDETASRRNSPEHDDIT